MHQTDTNRTTTQSEDNTLTVVNHAYMIQCGRCQTVIEYDTQTDWLTVSLLVNEYLGTCPAKLDFHGPAPSHPPSETYDTQNAPSHNFVGKMDANDSKHDNPFIAGVYALHPSGAADVRRRSVWTSAPDIILDFGSNTEGNVEESKRSR